MILESLILALFILFVKFNFAAPDKEGINLCVWFLLYTKYLTRQKILQTE